MFNPIDGVAKLKVSSAETWGTASSDGTQSKNTDLAKNREKTVLCRNRRDREKEKRRINDE